MEFTPRPFEELKAKYPKAIERVYDVEMVEIGIINRPGESEEHYFDWEDGVRMIISKEDAVCGEHIHISASLQKGQLYDNFLSMGMGHAQVIKELQSICEEKFRSLSDCTLDMHFIVVTDHGVLHWRVYDKKRPTFSLNIEEDIDKKFGHSNKG